MRASMAMAVSRLMFFSLAILRAFWDRGRHSGGGIWGSQIGLGLGWFLKKIFFNWHYTIRKSFPLWRDESCKLNSASLY